MYKFKCVLIENCNSPKKVGNKLHYKPFMTGTPVTGVRTNIALTPESRITALKTDDGYIIPESFLNVVGVINDREAGLEEIFTDAEIVEDGGGERGKKYVSDFNDMKIGSIINQNKERSRYAINFAMGGLVIGLVYAMVQSKSKLIFASLGAVAGGVAGNIYGKKYAMKS